MRKKIWQNILAMTLALALLVSSVPTQVYALAGEALAEALEQNSENLTSDATGMDRGVYEVTELREANVKHFALEDGTYTAVMYGCAVHTQDADGNWQDIDNRLSDSGSEFSTNNARIKFAKKITGNETLFTLHDGNRKITMSLNNAIKKTTGSVTNTSTEFDSEATELQKLMTLDNLSSKILYADILDGVDLEYIVESLNVKENIIVKERKDSYQYTFTISLNNLEAEMVEDGSVRIYDPITWETVYNIPAGFMYDANGEYSTAVAYALIDNGNGKYSMAVDADAAWINAENRAFPVCIDPSITVDDFSIYEETYIDSSSSLLLGFKNGYLQVGSSCNAYWKLTTLPTLPAGYYITDAQFTITGIDPTTYDNSSTTLDIGIYDVTTDWSRSTLTYSRFTNYDEGHYSTHAHDSQYGADLHNRYTWNITQLARDWYNDPATNYGLAIICRDPFHSNLVYRFKCGAVGSPIRITYESIRGIENYWSYTTQNAGIAGTGYVNKATGELSFAIDTLSTTDALFGQTTTLVYNQAYAGKFVVSGVANVPNISPTFGYGIKMNVNEYLVSKTYVDIQGNTKTYYIWTDGDGTEHDFYPDGNSSTTYKDNDGLRLTLTVGDGIYEIEDTNHNVRTFTQTSEDRTKINDGAILSSTTDKNGNKLQYTYTDWGRIGQVRVIPNGSSSISYLQFVYNAYGQVKRIYNYGVDTAPKVKFYYSPSYSETTDISVDYKGYLKKIEFINENQVIATASYEYDSNGKLIAAHDDTSGYSVRYTYTGNQVTAITEYAGADDTQGQTISLTYKDGYTEIRSSGSDDQHGTTDDLITTYIFDSHCRVTSTYSTDAGRTTIYGASSGEYESQENVKNNIKTSATLGGISNVYLYNGGFEDLESSSSAKGWDEDNFTYVIAPAPTYGNYSAQFAAAANATGSLKQYVQLPEGKFTLALDVNSRDIPGADFTISIAPLTNPTNILEKQSIPLNKSYASAGFVTVNLQFDTTQYEEDKFVISIDVKCNNSTNYTTTSCIIIDNVVLEENLGHLGYNMVQFGNFESYDLDEDGFLNVRTSDYWSVSGNGYKEYIATLMNNVMYFPNNSTTYEERATQTVYTAPSWSTDDSPKTFTLSAMGYGSEQVATGFFGIEVNVYYSNQTAQTFKFPFQYACTEWQFVSGTFTTQAITISSISVSLVYRNPGTACFDNIYLTQFIDESTVFNEYDAEGRVTARRTGYYEEFFAYNDEGDVTRVANSQGEIYDYTYDSHYRPVSITYCKFIVNSDESTVYPNHASDPDALITKTPITITQYEYNSFGLTKSIVSNTILSAEDLAHGEEVQTVSTAYTYIETAGSRYIGALTSETDNLGVETKYFYDTKGNLLAVVNTSTGTGTCYAYDIKGNVTSVMPATWTVSEGYAETTDEEKINYSYNEADLLEKIETNTTAYHFTYDCFGNAETIGVGKNTASEIIRYEYNSYNGKLKKIHYANGFVIEYCYDALENVSEVRYTTSGSNTSTIAYTYSYDAYGQLYRFDNKLTGMSIIYKYDTNKRLVGFVEFNNETNVNKFSATILYDDNSQVSMLSYVMDYACGSSTANYNIVYNFVYDSDSTLRDFELEIGAVSGVVNFCYDDLQRLSARTYDFVLSSNTDQKFVNTVNYTYTTVDGGTSTQVQTYTTQIDNDADNEADISVTYTYTYDDRGNVTKIETSTGQVFRYVYDDLDQLLREDNSVLGKTYVYTYDLAGNIQTKIIYNLTAEGAAPSNPIYTYNYGYGDANWGDKLTSYNNAQFTYDANGNPTTYNNGTAWEFDWEFGSQLAAAYTGNTVLVFDYNDDGIRTQKRVGTVEHEYTLNGAQIVSEKWGYRLAVYIYDVDGMPIGMQYRTNSYDEGVFDVYWFERNLQGDILAVYDASGTKLVSYTYDAWGNVTTTYHNGGENTAAKYNPFRYRGYYYDTELEMYYLQTRYYDPAIGRFLNADSYISSDSSVLGCNMFAYCGNNPVMGYDPTGEFSWGTLFSGASLLAIGITACAAAITVVTAGACTPLLIAATVTFVAGAATVVNGTAEVIESVTDYNFVRDGLLQGNEELYERQKEILAGIAEIGTALITMGSASGKLCFAAGTVILVNEGRKAIEDIVVGDYVWAWDEETGEKSLRRVTETYVNQTSELVHVFVGGEEIVTTPTHPFYSPVKGWTEAAQLRAGDILVLVNGEYVVVEKVQHEILESPINVYNFQVAGDHTYYVSDIGVLVHNACNQIGGGHGESIHKARIDKKINELISSGNYSDVFGNRSLKTAGLVGNQRPDIIAKKLNGTFEVWEFASKSQAGGSGLAALKAKIEIMKAANPTAHFYEIIPWG